MVAKVIKIFYKDSKSINIYLKTRKLSVTRSDFIGMCYTCSTCFKHDSNKKYFVLYQDFFDILNEINIFCELKKIIQVLQFWVNIKNIFIQYLPTKLGFMPFPSNLMPMNYIFFMDLNNQTFYKNKSPMLLSIMCTINFILLINFH